MHGCFWHGHDCKRGARAPKQNAAYWSAKIGRNRARDAESQAKLAAIGWRSIVVWECVLKDEVALRRRLAEALETARQAASAPAVATGASAESSAA